MICPRGGLLAASAVVESPVEGIPMEAASEAFDPTSPVPPMTTILILSLSRALGKLESEVRV